MGKEKKDIYAPLRELTFDDWIRIERALESWDPLRPQIYNILLHLAQSTDDWIDIALYHQLNGDEPQANEANRKAMSMAQGFYDWSTIHRNLAPQSPYSESALEKMQLLAKGFRQWRAVFYAAQPLKRRRLQVLALQKMKRQARTFEHHVDLWLLSDGLLSQELRGEMWEHLEKLAINAAQLKALKNLKRP